MRNSFIKLPAFLLILTGLFLQSCIADIRTATIKKEGITPDNEKKGKAILDQVWERQGMEAFTAHSVYSYKGQDTWQGMLGKMGKLWADNQTQLEFKYAINTFDGKATFLDGKRTGTSVGLQSWEYYEQAPGAEVEFMKKEKRAVFGLAAFQYFNEMPDRLIRVPIISFAGEKTFRGNTYDQVFVTWHKPEPHKENDQYLMWVNQKTGMVDYVVYTLRDNYLKMPGGKTFYGSIEYGDYKTIDGAEVSHKHTVYLKMPKKKESKNLHQLIVTDFQFDDFEAAELYPNSKLAKLGDTKK